MPAVHEAQVTRPTRWYGHSCLSYCTSLLVQGVRLFSPGQGLAASLFCLVCLACAVGSLEVRDVEPLLSPARLRGLSSASTGNVVILGIRLTESPGGFEASLQAFDVPEEWDRAASDPSAY
ncbi:hypothetical protein Micbo1qcDRAFT_220837 [Microdochium bolleyi]|uniref:Uncharacterized protein n=1 Tax=Microdochium bolleyi TaxID=196109 RepID=A0A136JAQ8_9PEZI|nr:hypothetical protein Micbo1qcDRAFT_220837 [Microdochium bolleyi]